NDRIERDRPSTFAQEESKHYEPPAINFHPGKSLGQERKGRGHNAGSTPRLAIAHPLPLRGPRSTARNCDMTDFAAARRMMVDGQVRTSDVTDLRIVAGMLELPRERCVPAAKADPAYLAFDIVVKEGRPGAPARRLLKPMVLAKMVQAAEVDASDHVLDLGCATGYSSALLSRLAASVVALEEDEGLARLARENLKAVGAGTSTVMA